MCVISDEMAYREYLEGREESADILVDRYGDALTYYINGYIHDIHESEDLMIEAFARVFAKEGPFSHCLMSIFIKNISLQIFKH